MTAGILGTNSPFQMTFSYQAGFLLSSPLGTICPCKKVVLVVAWVEGVARSAREGTSLSEEAGIMADQGDLLDVPT